MKAEAHQRVPIPQLQGYNCFACGTDNPVGLGLTFYRLGHMVCADVVLDQNRVGWQNIAHGGIVSTLLDEVMAWTVLVLKRSFTVTRELKVRFRKPVAVGEAITVRGWIKEGRSRRFAAALHAEVVDEQGAVLAEADGDFALLQGAQLELLPERVRRDVAGFMDALDQALTAQR